MKTSHLLLAAITSLPFTPNALGQARASFKACLDRASIESAQYPQKLDKDMTVTGVSCRQADGRVIYVYENKLAAHKSMVPKNAMKKQAVTMRNMLCSDPNLMVLLKLVDMEYTYYDIEGVFLGRLTNRIEDCARR